MKVNDFKNINSLPMRFIVFFLCCLSANLLSGQTATATEDLALIRVLVTDMEGKIRPSDKIIFQGKTTQKSFEGISNQDGLFKILLPDGDIYQIKIQGLGEQVDFDEVNIPVQPGIVQGSLQVKYRPEKSFTLDDVHFETNKAILKPESFPALHELVEILQLKPEMSIEIAGHTDAVGSEESNLTLSQNRAESVVNFLIKNGVDRQRLVAKGYGESQPIASNDSDEGRQLNRRTEARILN